jgi:hypothetical protein
MQQLLKLLRRLVYLAAGISLFWAGYQVIARPYISENTGKILVIYDGDSTMQKCRGRVTSDREDDAEEAIQGFCDAMLESTKGKAGPEELLNMHTELQDQTAGKEARIYQQLASRVARGPVLGVISFLTSPDSPAVVRFCRTMQIPLLLAVAANDDLMAVAEDTRGIVFRMIPTNRQQATDMAEWLQGQIHSPQPLRVALFHEPNSFGEFLHRELAHDLRPQIKEKQIILYNFEVTPQLEFADLMPQLWCRDIDLVAYLGFEPRALDLLNKLKSYRDDLHQASCHPKKLSVLLSSGSYQEDLNDRDKYNFPFKVFAMLSTRPAGNNKADTALTNASQDDEETQAYEYGYDSYTLLERLANQRFGILLQTVEHSKTGHDYSFDENGELIKSAETNKYHAYELPSPKGRKP